MKRFMIIVLVLVVIGVGFYWGYQKVISSKQQSALSNQQNGITKSASSGSITLSLTNPTTIPQDAITRETTMVVNLDTPTTIFDNDGGNSKLEMTVKPRASNSDAAKKGQFLVDMMLTTPPPNIRLISPKMVTSENKKFTFSIGGNPAGSTNKGSNIVLDGIVNSISENQVEVTIKLSSW